VPLFLHINFCVNVISWSMIDENFLLLELLYKKIYCSSPMNAFEEIE